MSSSIRLSVLLLSALFVFAACGDDDFVDDIFDGEMDELVQTYADRYEANLSYPAATTRLDDFDDEAAYDFQEEFVEELVDRGDEVTGWKLGFTGDAPRPFGAPGPLFGRLLRSQSRASGSTIDISDTWVMGAVGVEVALIIGRDAEFELTDFPLSREQVLNLVEGIAPLTEFPELGFEEGLMGINYRDLIANNAGAKAYVLGETTPLSELQIDIDSIDVRIFRDDSLIGESFSGDALGSQVEALEALLRHLAERDVTLRAGSIIATGSLGGDLGLEPGEYRFEYEQLGTNTFTLVE
ncbi:2-keto-4-pentenoate hydratase [Neolewinella litorea]|uniref:Fumarylacetoacetase-like C-terminal domain-containing protein n=1 Tax=Neolewinella litorea TaxID=2562452 RepID=A0A4S4NPE0_9BACT|nr:fumarylacetoacetate hydrolase family protein [Neolewinella litorea]THH41772.1 hypothetical protein E4021_04060 [Neolewinella litorea]